MEALYHHKLVDYKARQTLPYIVQLNSFSFEFIIMSDIFLKFFTVNISRRVVRELIINALVFIFLDSNNSKSGSKLPLQVVLLQYFHVVVNIKIIFTKNGAKL